MELGSRIIFNVNLGASENVQILSSVLQVYIPINRKYFLFLIDENIKLKKNHH